MGEFISRASGPVLIKDIYIYIKKSDPIISTSGGTELVFIIVGNDRENELVPHEEAVASCPLYMSL